MVRFGTTFARFSRSPTAMVIATPAPSSIAPVPRSHESRCAASSTISSGFSLPVISPITFAPLCSPSKPTSSFRRTRTGWLRSSTRDSRSASGLLSAAAGIGVAKIGSPDFVRFACFIASGSASSASRDTATPVCGRRSSSVPIERISSARAPSCAAAAAPCVRAATAGP